MKQKIKQLQSLLLLLILTVVGTANAWATYTPTADEVIILKDVYDASKTDAGYSKHAAIAWGATTSSNSKTAGDPNNGGAATSSNVPCYSVKGNTNAKRITVSITGVSKIIIYHESHNSRFVELRSGSISGTLLGKSTASTYYTEVDLTPSTDYSIFLHGVDSKGDTDFHVYAIKLVISGAATTYTVSFADGTCGDHGTYDGKSKTQADAGANITLPTVAADDGYRFDGWYTNNDGTGTKYASGATMKPGSSQTLYAWYVQQFTVAYDGNGKTDGNPPTDSNSPYDAGSDVSVLGNTSTKPLTKTNYTFAGWNTSSSGTVSTHYNADDDFAISANTTFYAVWKHQVNLAVNDGAMGSVSATYNTADSYYNKAKDANFISGGFVSHDVKLTLTATPNTGYHFAGSWGGGTGATSNPATVPVGDNKTYTAQFAVNTYSVAFNANGGSGSMSNQNFTYGTAQNLTSNAFERSGYTFAGWATAADGAVAYTNAQEVNNLTDEHEGVVTLYAKWTQTATPTVTYVDAHEKGTVPAATTSSTLTSAILSATPTSITSGYSFKEWCTDAELTIPAVAETAITENTTLYANYTINSAITVSPEANSTLVKGGSVTSTHSGMTIYAAWGGAEQSFETVIGTTGKTSPRTDGFTYTDAGSDKVLSLVASDGTFYSAVQTFTYKAGTVAPVITCAANKVTITSETAGATIRYTTNGTDPTPSTGTVYSAPFPITGPTNVTVKAIAYKEVESVKYSSAVTTQACEYVSGDVSTALPMTYNFRNKSKWTESTGNFITTTSSLVTKENRAQEDSKHNIVFRVSAQDKFYYTSGEKMTMKDNASSSNFMAIPISGINGRLDIDVWTPYKSTDEYTLRYILDTSNGTTVKTDAPSDITKKKNANKYDTDHFNFRMENITATSGVLYIGRGEASFPDFYQIKVSTPSAYLVPDKTSVTMNDGEVETVMITNNSAYQALLKNVPSYVDAAYDPTTGELVITPKTAGSDGSITFAVDTDGDGEASSTDLTIPVTVHGITISTQPSSAVYDTSSGSPEPALAAITVSASHSNGATLSYQWYKNTVNSTVGGTAISGATTNSLATSEISTSADEDASFYYCQVSAASCKTKTTNVVYVLTSKTKRYFQLSNVAGNEETATNNEEITGQVIAGGHAYVQTSENYRYITRPNTNVPHMYAANNSDKYIKVILDKPISSASDIISVILNGVDSNARGIVIYNSDLTKSVTLSSGSDGNIKSYAAAAGVLNGQSTLYIKGIAGSEANYFTDLIIYKTSPFAVTAPTPDSQDLQVGDTPATISVTATGGTGAYTYRWYRNTEESTTGAVEIVGATSASYTPPTIDAAVDYVYYCLVSDGSTTQSEPTGYATVSVSSDLSHGYMTIDGNKHEELTFSFDANGKCSYTLLKSPYDTQNKATATAWTNFWTHEGDFSSGVKIASISSSNANYLRIKKDKSMTFYVRRATSFTIESGTNSSRQYKVTVDDVDMGTYSVNSESPRIALDHEGSKIVITSITSDIYIGRLNFYYSSMEIKKGSETVTEAVQYTDGGAVDYEVQSNSTGAIEVNTTATGYDATVATASYNSTTGLLTVTPASSPYKEGTCVVTLTQAESGDYAASTTTLTVTVKKHTLALEFSLDDTEIPLAVLSSGSAIPSGSLPTLSVKLDGETLTSDQITAKGINIKYKSDDITIGRFATDPGTSYNVIYGGGQGGALIYAYVPATTHVSAAKDYFGLNVKAGASNALPSTAKAGENQEIYEQNQFELQDNDGSSAVTLTYGGYKYDKEGGWTNASSRDKYHIDGFKYYTRHDIDALDEYGYQLRGMSDESLAAPSSLELTKKMDHHSYNHTYHLSSWSSQNVGDHTFWYTTSEQKPDGSYYKEYERIRPFTLPCYGGYLKFETHKTGTLTIYIWQNGSINAAEKDDSKKLGSKPRLSYWFDQDGWVKQPKVAPITKQPITNSKYGHDTFCDALTTEGKLATKWTAANGDAEIIPMLLRRYCNSSKTAFSNTQETGYIENPYYWMTSNEIKDNLDEELTIIPKKVTPVPYHNGYMVPEESYLKYVIDVVAGKTYYFYGMMTKIGYVGMNFIEDNSVVDVENKDVLHLNINDNMETLVSNLGHAYTVYNEATLPSTYKADQWSTICLPFALSESQVEEAFGKGTQLTLYNGLIKKGNDYTIKYLSHVDSNILPGQPYFIKPTGLDKSGNPLPKDLKGNIGSTVDGAVGTRITFNTVVIDKKQFDIDKCKYSSDENVNESGEDLDEKGYVFTASTHNNVLAQYSYVMNGGLLRRYTGSTKQIPTYMAYLKPNTPAAQSGSMSISADFSEDSMEYTWKQDVDPTDVISIKEEVVEALNSGKIVMPNKAYNLMGQEIDPRSAKGLVIINGKKVMY